LINNNYPDFKNLGNTYFHQFSALFLNYLNFKSQELNSTILTHSRIFVKSKIMGKQSSDFHYKYPHPALTVDAMVFTFDQGLIKVLLIRRADEPFKDAWAFPGGFVNENETVESAVTRELLEETGVRNIRLHQFYTASAPGRDPRGWTVSVIFQGMIPIKNVKTKAGDDAKEVTWHPIYQPPGLAFDHDKILERGINQIIKKMRFVWLAKILLEENFSEDQLFQLGLQTGIQKSDLQQRFDRFLRLGLILTSEEGFYHFNPEKFEKSE
jgi:8-oxo-dGTP diphosphatase